MSRSRSSVIPRRPAPPPTLLANITGNNGLSATTATVSFVIPGTVTDTDLAVISLASLNSESVNITAEPATAYPDYGPDRITGQNASSWLYIMPLTEADQGTTVTWTFGTALRNIGHMAIYSNVTDDGGGDTGAIASTPGTTATITPNPMVSAGALVHATIIRKVDSGTAPDVGAFTGYTQGANARTATAFGSGVNGSIEVAYRVATTSGTYGGETASVASSVGVSYTISRYRASA